MNNYPTKQNSDNAKLGKFTLQDFVQLILSNWYWFVLSMLICLGCAAFYLRRTAPVYQRSASVLVKDSRKGSSAEISAFNDLLGGGIRRSVDNEIYIFQSRRLMEEVIGKLDLTIQYTQKGRIRVMDLYGRSPILVKYVNAKPNESGKFNAHIVDEQTVVLSDFSVDGDFHATVSMGDTISTPMGIMTVRQTPYVSQYIDRDITISKLPLNETIEAYRSKLQCEIRDKQASVISLTMNDVVPKRAEDVINGIIDAYNIDAINDKRTISDITEKFINDRLAILGKELTEADSDVAAFKQAYKIYSPEEEASQSATELSSLKSQSLSLEGSLEMARYIRDFINNDTSERSLIPAATVTMSGASTALASQISIYNEQVLNRQRLLANSSANSPVIIELENNIAAMREAIISSLDSHIKGLSLQLDNIRREQNIADRRIASSPVKEKELLSMSRQQKVKEELYIYLLTKREENSLTGATAESNARIIDTAYGSNKPISPKKTLIYIIAVVLGAVIPFAMLYIIELLNTTVRGRKEIEESLSIPFLGDIPTYHGKAEHGIAVRATGRDTVSEAFRILRTNMSFMSIDSEQKVILVTSSTPHSGKTFVSTNLAMTLATSGKRVLLMDFDLRRRTLSKQLGHRSDRRGITGYLSGAIAKLEDAISKTSIDDNFDMMYAGIQPPNPAEMLMSQRVDNMISDLRKMYDYIILDSTPAMAIADAMIIDRVADLTIYVVLQGYLDRRQLPDIEKLYREKKFHNMCIVLNGVDSTSKTYGYGYGYGYGYYGYGYGYYCDDEKRSTWKRYKHKLKKLFKKRK